MSSPNHHRDACGRTFPYSGDTLFTSVPGNWSGPEATLAANSFHDLGGYEASSSDEDAVDESPEYPLCRVSRVSECCLYSPCSRREQSSYEKEETEERCGTCTVFMGANDSFQFLCDMPVEDREKPSRRRCFLKRLKSFLCSLSTVMMNRRGLTTNRVSPESRPMFNSGFRGHRSSPKRSRALADGCPNDYHRL